MQFQSQRASTGNVFPPRRERRSSRRSHWTRRRKIAIAIVALILSTPLLAAGYYVWNITDAIGDAQDVSVMDLPERTVQRPASDDEDPGASGLAATPQAGPQQPAGPSNDNPSSFDVARGIFSAGTGGESTSPDKVWPQRDHINVMVLGVDTRPDGGDQNADVIIIARIDLEKNTMRSVSIPRDLLVDIPGHGQGKINGAYGIGVEAQPDNRVAGVAMMRDTIEYNFGLTIDDYVLVDFDGFKEVVDAVGGIEINVPTRIEDPEFPTEDYGTRTLVIEAGRQEMDGETALAYARTRHGDSDDERRERQMLVIRALFEKGRDLGTLTRVADVITAVSGAALTSLHWDEQLALASIALEMNSNGIQMRNLEQPLIQPGTAENGAWVYVGDLPAISAFIESTLAGEEPVTVVAGPVGS
jgi:LCP family protein required for cell wall assembly